MGSQIFRNHTKTIVLADRVKAVGWMLNITNLPFHCSDYISRRHLPLPCDPSGFWRSVEDTEYFAAKFIRHKHVTLVNSYQSAIMPWELWVGDAKQGHARSKRLAMPHTLFSSTSFPAYERKIPDNLLWTECRLTYGALWRRWIAFWLTGLARNTFGPRLCGRSLPQPASLSIFSQFIHSFH